MVREQGDIHIIDMPEKTDLYSAMQLKNKITEIMEAGAGKVIINLSAAKTMGSPGIGSLAFAAQHVQTEKQGLLRLVQVQPEVLRLLQQTRMDGRFTILETEEEGVQSLAD